MSSRSLARALNPLRGQPDIHDDLFRPTYQNRLRIIGQHLDSDNYRAMHLLEVHGGMLVRAARRHDGVPELLEFPDESFRALIAEAIGGRGRRRTPLRHPAILPTGYEDFLRALGYELDRASAKAIALVESDEFVFVSGMERVRGSLSGFAPFSCTLRELDIVRLLDDAFHRREV